MGRANALCVRGSLRRASDCLARAETLRREDRVDSAADFRYDGWRARVRSRSNSGHAFRRQSHDCDDLRRGSLRAGWCAAPAKPRTRRSPQSRSSLAGIILLRRISGSSGAGKGPGRRGHRRRQHRAMDDLHPKMASSTPPCTSGCDCCICGGCPAPWYALCA